MKLLTGILMILLLVVVACSSGDTETPTPDPPTAPSIPMAMQAPSPTPPSVPTSQTTQTPSRATSTTAALGGTASRAKPGTSSAPSNTSDSIATSEPMPVLRPPNPLQRIYSHTLPGEQFLVPSLARQIISSEVIVLANFVSVAAGTETVPCAEGELPTYRRTMTLNFRAVEYLKGTGPTNFKIEIRDIGGEQYWDGGERYNGYLTESKALEEDPTACP